MFASANRVEMWRIRETNWGVLPPTPAWVETRFTGESLDDAITTETSKEIRSDRQTTDLVVVDAEPGGAINIELSAQSFDDLIEAVLMGEWGNDLGISNNTIAFTANGVSSVTAGLFSEVQPGQWVFIGEAAVEANNGFFQVTSKNATSLTFSVSTTPTAAGDTITIKGSTLTNGVEERSYSLMKRYSDLGNETRQQLSGMRVATFSLDMQTASLMTGSFGFKGKSAEWQGAANIPAGETFGAAETHTTMNCVNNIQAILQNGSVLGTPGSVMSMQFNLDNQHRSQKGLGVLGNAGVAAGSLALTLTASLYFEDKTQADKFKGNEEFSWSFRLIDTEAQRAYVFTLPRCKYESFSAPATGLDSDVMADTTVRALRKVYGDNTSSMIRVDRIFWG